MGETNRERTVVVVVFVFVFVVGRTQRKRKIHPREVLEILYHHNEQVSLSSIAPLPSFPCTGNDDEGVLQSSKTKK